MADIKSGDMHHSIIRSFDEATDSLKTTITNADVNINVSAFTDSIAIADVSGNKVTTTLVGGKRSFDVNVTDITLDATNDSVAIKNGTNQLAVNLDGSINVVSSGLTDTQLRASAVPVSGTFFQATQPVSIASTVTVSGPLTDSQLRLTPLPISGTVSTGGLTDAQLRLTAVPVSLTSTTITNFPATQPVSAVSLPLPSGASSETTLSALNTKVPSGLTVTANRLQVELPAGGTGLTNTELRASAVPVSLTSTTITGSVAVTGPLTDTQLRLTAVPVSLTSTTITNFPATQAVSGPLTDSQLRLTPVPISGTVAVSNPGLTDTQLRASAVPVSLASTTITGTVTANATLSAETIKVIGTVNISAGQSIAANAGTNLNTSALNLESTQSAMSAKLPAALGQGTMAQGLKVSLASDQSSIPVSSLDTTTSGSITAISQSVALALNGKSGVALQIAGTWVGTLQFEGTVDGTNWATLNGVVAGTSTPGPTTTTNGIIRLTPSGLAQVRATSTAWTSGTATVSLRASDATGGTFLNQSLTAGTNSIGTVQPPAITKGTQGTVGLTVQRLIDAGRNARHFMLDAHTAAPAIEAVQSVVQWYGNAAVIATTQPAVVPAGKTLRLQSWSISTKSLATVGSAVVRVRVNTAGLGVLASPLVFSFEAGSKSGATTIAMTGGLDSITGVFPEGFEIPAGAGLAFSMAGYGPAGVLALQGVTRFSVTGYEY